MTANPDRACDHPDFEAYVDINRVGTGDTPDGSPAAFVADIRVNCAACGEKFRWTGVRAGLSYAHPMVSVDETELHAKMATHDQGDFDGLGKLAQAQTEMNLKREAFELEWLELTEKLG